MCFSVMIVWCVLLLMCKWDMGVWGEIISTDSAIESKILNVIELGTLLNVENFYDLRVI